MTFHDALERRLAHQLPLDRNPVLNGIADLRSAIQRATIARQRFNAAITIVCSETRFGELETAYLDGINDVRDALGGLGMTPGEINALGEVLS